MKNRDPDFWPFAATIAFLVLGVPLLVLGFFTAHPEYWEMFRLWVVSFVR